MSSACGACGGTLVTWRGAYQRCLTCSSLQVETSLVPTPEQNLSRYTRPGYLPEGGARGGIYHPGRLRALRRMCGRGGRLLEIGCGSGEFAEAALRAGFEVTAIEPGSLYEAAQRRVGDVALQATWESFLPQSAGSFDVVVAWEVIEHLVDPATFLEMSTAAVRAGGVFALRTPNAASWSIRVLGTEDPILCADEHLRIFSQAGLRRLLRDAGLANVRIRGFGHLLPEEASRGFSRLVSQRQPPARLAGLASKATRLLRHPRISLGLEAFARVGRPEG